MRQAVGVVAHNIRLPYEGLYEPAHMLEKCFWTICHLHRRQNRHIAERWFWNVSIVEQQRCLIAQHWFENLSRKVQEISDLVVMKQILNDCKTKNKPSNQPASTAKVCQHMGI